MRAASFTNGLVLRTKENIFDISNICNVKIFQWSLFNMNKQSHVVYVHPNKYINQRSLEIELDIFGNIRQEISFVKIVLVWYFHGEFVHSI